MIDLDLIKAKDKKYPKTDRKHNSVSWRTSHMLLKNKRSLLKWSRVVRCEPTMFELRGVCSCPTCGQPMSRRLFEEKGKDAESIV
jgi:hypothetical protein